ncbi:MAG: hypothetical protein PVH62_07390 [Anaerolineae bacterium]|jgi:hypothetical protein
MSSHEPLSIQPVDLLIVEALQDQVEGTEPSPQVWKRVRRQARSWAIGRRPQSAWSWNVFLERVSEMDTASARAGVSPSDSPLCWGYDLLAASFFNYSGMIFRFAW